MRFAIRFIASGRRQEVLLDSASKRATLRAFRQQVPQARLVRIERAEGR